MYEADIKLFTVRGIPVGLNWTWVFVFLLVVWSLSAVVFPSSYPELSGGTHIVMGLVAAVLFFVSILIHELSHALRALREGVHVREITLWLFGGVSRIEEPLPTPGAALRVAGAGPLASAALAVGFLAVGEAAHAVGAGDAVVGVCSYLGWINGLLLVFNVVPALPLDGGRLLHAVLWWRSGDRVGATLSASRAGRVFGIVLVAVGLLGLFGGSGIGGIWFVFLGWFLLQAVREEEVAARLEDAVEGLRVRDLMVPDPVAVAPDLELERFAAVTRRSPHGAYPVVVGDHLVGLVTRRASVESHRRGERTVADVMLTGERVPRVHADDGAIAVLDRLATEPGRAVVVGGPDDDEVVGLVSVSDYSAALSRRPRRVPTGRQRHGRSWLVPIWFVVALVIVSAGAALYHPPYVVISPGDAFDVRGDISVTGVAVGAPSGPYIATSVRLDQPSALGLLIAAIRQDREIVPLGDVLPAGISSDEADRLQQQLFVDSRQLAAAAAAEAAGFDASLSGDGVRVLGVVASSPASSVLDVDDVIVEVQGMTVATTDDLRGALAGTPAGATVDVVVTRDDRRVELETETTDLPDVAGGVGLGVLGVTEQLRVVLPFDVEFRPRPNVGGTSAGLVFALAITDLLEPADLAASRSIAATGTIDADGSVGEVGGVAEKAIAARDAGAELFLVPRTEVADVGADGVEVRGVTDLAQAVAALDNDS